MKPIILGLYGLSKNHKDISGYGVVKNSDAINILKKAWGIGIRYLDTAPSYGKGNADFLIIMFSLLFVVLMDLIKLVLYYLNSA